MQGQQMGAMSAAMPNQLSGQMHGQVGAPMGNHLPTRGPGFPAGYGPQGQMQTGGAGMQGMLGRPGGQRPPLPGRNSATLQQGKPSYPIQKQHCLLFLACWTFQIFIA